MKTDAMRCLAAIGAVLFVAGGVTAQTIDWDGGPDDESPDPNTSGNWSVPENWAGDVAPASADDARLGPVSANRTVTVDVASTVNRILFDQDDPDYINKLSLGANLTLNRASASGGNPIWTLTLSNGATFHNIVTDFNGNSIRVADSLSTTSNGPLFSGVFNFNAIGSEIRYDHAGHLSFRGSGVFNVTADGAITRDGGTGDANYQFLAASTVNINNGTLFIGGSGGWGTSDRGINVTNNGLFHVAADGALSVRETRGVGTRGNARFTNSATGTMVQAGRIEMRQRPHAESDTRLTNNGAWTVSGGAATIKRLDSDAIIYVPVFTNNSTGTLRGSGASDTLEFDEETEDGTRRMTITNNGVIMPGAGSQGAGLASVGDLVLRDINVTMGTHANATVALDIGGASAGQFDRLLLTGGTHDLDNDRYSAGAGTLDLTEGGTLQLWTVNGFVDPTPGAWFSIALIEAGDVQGQFSTVRLDTDAFTANELDRGDGTKYVLGYSGTEVTLHYIPEPGSVGLLALGAMLLLRRRRRG